MSATSQAECGRDDKKSGFGATEPSDVFHGIDDDRARHQIFYSAARAWHVVRSRAALPRSIRAKLLIVFLTLSAMTALLGTYGISKIRDVGLIAAATYDQPLMAINYARSAQITFERLADAEINGKPTPSEIAEGDDLAQSMLDDLTIVEQRASSMATTQVTREVRALSMDWIKLSRHPPGPGDTSIALYKGPTSKQLRDAFEKLSEQLATDGFIQRRLAIGATTKALHSSIFATSATVLFALLMTLMMSRLIVAPLTAAATVANRIGAGDMITPIVASGRDEAGALLSSMAYMQDKLLERRIELEGQIAAVTGAKEALRLAHDDIQKTAGKLGEANSLLVMAGRMAKIGHWHLDRAFELRFSDELYRIYGISPDVDRQGLEVALEKCQPNDWQKLRDLMQRAVDTGEGFSCEIGIIREDGAKRDLAMWSQTEQNPDGSISGIFGVVQDITERKDAEREHAKLSERVRLATDAGRIGIWEWTPSGESFIADKQMFDLYGLDDSAGNLPIGEWIKCLHADDHDRMVKYLTEAVTFGYPYDLDYRIVRVSAEVRHLRTRGSVLLDADGKPERMLGVVWDVTELRVLAEQLHEEKERLQITLSSIGDAVVATDEQSCVTFMNPVAEELMGWELAEAYGRPLREIFHLVFDEIDAVVESPVERCLASQEVIKLEDGVSLISRDGNRYAIQDSVGPVRTQSGEVIGAVLVFQDVSRAREMQKALSFSATHDALTGLFNRAKFENECQSSLDLVRRTHATHALCFVDLDRFKLVNDTAGHAAGDMLLRKIAAAMNHELRSTDVIARLGGDEFGLLLQDCPVSESHEICSKLIETISAIRLPWNGKLYDVGASVGIVMMTSEAASLGELMSQADVACYASKHGGRNRASIYDESQSAAGEQHKEIFKAVGLKNAIENNRFTLYAQEIVATSAQTKSNRLELLLRMIDEDGRIILPGALIPAAERFGLMMSIDRWVIKEALITMGPEIARRKHLKIAINLSGNSLSDPHFLDEVLAIIKQSPVRPEAIQFEITETAMMSNLGVGNKLVMALREIGCSIALDDFGSGVSSFTYLRSFQADLIKIDGNFVRNVATSTTDLAIVESINALAHRLGVKTLAKAIESYDTLEKIRMIGTDYVQGYVISPPAPLASKLREIDADRERTADALSAA